MTEPSGAVEAVSKDCAECGGVRDDYLGFTMHANSCPIYGTAATAARARSAPSDQEKLTAEEIAQFLHDEGGFDEAWSQHTWPEHADDTGQRDGGWVKIVPSDVQAKFRDVATRLKGWMDRRPERSPK